MRTEKDLWVEMSIREIWTQANFAEIAYSHIDPKADNGNDAVFSSIHSFLSHCAMVSKMLKANDQSQRKGRIKTFYKYLIKFGLYKNKKVKKNTIGSILGIERSIIHEREFRNHLEHYDERLKEWIRQCGTDVNIGTYNTGPKSGIEIPNMLFISHYDPSTQIFTFINNDFDLSKLYTEVQKIKLIADVWVTKVQNGIIAPPFA